MNAATAPSFPGQAHGEMQGNHIWDDEIKAWVAMEHIAEPDEDTIRKEFEGALVKAGVTDERIAQLKEHALKFDYEYNTKAERNAADTARKQIRQVRLIGEKNMDRIHSRYTALWKLSNELKKRVLPRLNEPESIIEKRIAEFDAEQERVAREAAEAEARMIRERVIALEGFGFSRKAGAFPEPDTFVNGSGTVITTAQVEVKDEQVWTNLIRGVEQVWQEENDRREAEERRVAEERTAREEEERRLAEQRAEIERKQAELNKTINTIRKNELLALGCVEDGDAVTCRVDDPVRPRSFSFFVPALHNHSDIEWQERLAYARGVVAEKKHADDRRAAALEQERLQKEAERIRIGELQDVGALPDEYPALPLHQYDEERWKEEVRMVRALVDKREEDTRKELLITERMKALMAAGWDDDGGSLALYLMGGGPTPSEITPKEFLHEFTNDEFHAMLERGRAELARREEEKAEAIRKQERERIAAQQEQERKDAERRAAQMTDIEKWEAFIALIESSAPKMESPIGNHAVGRVIKGLREMSHKVIEDLKK